MTGVPDWWIAGRRAAALGMAASLAVLAAASAGCARPSKVVAPPTAPQTAPGQSLLSASPTPSPSPPSIASLTGAAGQLLWSRPGLPANRAVAVGDAVAVVEGLSGVSASPPGSSARVPYRFVALDAETGKVRATHRLNDGASTAPVPLAAKAYRGKPVAALSLRRDSNLPGEEAYDPVGRRVWTSPRDGDGLFGDEGEYALLSAYTKPLASGPLIKYQELKSLTGTKITGFGPGRQTLDGEIVFVHADAAVITERVQTRFRVITIAQRPRTLWSSTESGVAPSGFSAAEPVAVVDGRLLVQWTDARTRYQLALHDLKKGTTAWRSETLAGGVTQGAVVLDTGSHIAVAGSDGTGPTLGIDIRTGKISWRLAGQRSVRPVAASKGRVYGASGDTAVAVDARTGKAVTLGTHVDVAGVTSDGVLVLQGDTSPATGRVWAFRPP